MDTISIEEELDSLSKRIAEQIEKTFGSCNNSREEVLSEVNKYLSNIKESIESGVVFNRTIESIVEEIDEIISDSQELQVGYTERENDFKADTITTFRTYSACIEQADSKEEILHGLENIATALLIRIQEKEAGNFGSSQVAHANANKYMERVEGLIERLKRIDALSALDMERTYEKIIDVASEVEQIDRLFERESMTIVDGEMAETRKSVEEQNVTVNGKVVIEEEKPRFSTLDI